MKNRLASLFKRKRKKNEKKSRRFEREEERCLRFYGTRDNHRFISTSRAKRLGTSRKIEVNVIIHDRLLCNYGTKMRARCSRFCERFLTLQIS
ncbi:hypothetical protein ANTQUA_LOCUS367 [Anthophora quadrimaculata]